MAAPQTAVQIGIEYVDPKQSLVRNADQQSRAAANVIRNNLGGVTREFSNAGGAVRQFDQQLERANKRVLALGASVTVLYGTINAFKQLVAVTTQVEKNLVEINSIFQLNTRDLDKFGKTLLNVAQQTGQSLDQVANAAKEFSRQGLGVEETAKRTRDAMILVRLTGLEATKSVDLLTAAMNTFGKTGADTTNILNKLVAVDRAFAVSSKDIAEALARVGSVVDDANISLDQFAGLVTAARQITSREGAVIGNSLKTIFTRLERSSTLDQLESFGIAVRDASGSAKSAIEVFNSLASSYGRLNREQQQQVTELAAGVFQINQFKALLLDLGKANGIAAQATSIATKATNEALIANAALNDSLSASIQRLQNSATQAASVVGNIAVAPALKNAMGGINLITESIADLSSTGATKAGEDFGKYLGESILKGVANVLAGPGLIFLARSAFGIAFRSLRETFSESRQAASIAPRTFERFTNRGEEQSLQMVNTLLDQGTAKERQRFAAAKAVAEQEAIILSIMQRQAAVGANLGGVTPAVTSLRGRRVPGAAGGYLPMSEERAAISAGVGGAPASARPVYLPNFNRGRGQRGIVANSSEWMVPGAAGGAIYNQDMIRKYGLPPGAIPVAAGGYVPNAAFGSFLGMPGMGSPYDYPQRILRNPTITPATGFPSAYGQGFGQYTQNLPQSNAAIEQIGVLFQQLSKATNTLEASKFGPQIIDLAKSLDKIAEKQVLRDLANVFNSLPTRSESVQNAKIFYGTTTRANAIDNGSVVSWSGGAGGGVSRASEREMARQQRLSQIIGVTKAETFFNRKFQNLTLSDLSNASGLSDLSPTLDDRFSAAQISRTAAIGNIVGKGLKNYDSDKLQDAFKASGALASGKTLQEQFDNTVKDLVRSGSDLTSAYDAAIKQLVGETDNRKKINSIIRNSIPAHVAFERQLKEETYQTQALASATKKSTQGEITRQAFLNKAIKQFESEGMGVLDKGQKEVIYNLYRTNAAKTLGFSGDIASLLKNPEARRQIEELAMLQIGQGENARKTAATSAAQITQELNDQRRKERRAQFAGQLQLGLAGGSFAAGFIPDLPGGTLQAQAAGGLSGGVQGAAIGSAAGAFFGPIGVIAGSIIGGLGGAVKGFIEKSSKSFEELAKEISEANSRTVQVIAGASQFRNLQGNIQEAIERGQSGDVINSLFRQQRAASAQLPASVLRDLLEAGFDSEKQSAVFTKLAATQEEQTAAGALRLGLRGLTDPSKLGQGGLSGVATSLRGVVGTGGDRVASLLGRLADQGGSVSERPVGFYSGGVAPGGAAFNPALLAQATGVTADDLRKELTDIISKSKLSQSEKDEYVGYLKDAKAGVLVDFLKEFQKTADTGPLLDIGRRSSEQLSSLRTEYSALLRRRSERQALGGVSSQFQNRLTGLRERAALGLGGLTEQGASALTSQFALAAAQREAGTSNQQAFAAAKMQFSRQAEALSIGGPMLGRIEGATNVSDLEAIVSQFNGKEIKDKLGEVVSELKVTIAQNETMVALTKEDNRLNQLQLEAQQQQRLLASGTFTGNTGATARSLFSRFRGSSGAAQSVNAINLSSFLNQIGLPQTEEGQAFETQARSASVRDTLSAVLSARLGSRVGTSEAAIRQANERLAARGELGDDVVSGRVAAGLKSLSFNPEAERQKLISGTGTLSEQGLSQLSTSTLALRAPLETISLNTKESSQFLAALNANIEKQTLLQERTQLELQQVATEARLSSMDIDSPGARRLNEQRLAVKTRIGAINEQLAKPAQVVGQEVAAPIAKSMVEAAKEAGVVMGEAFMVSASKGGGGSLFQGFGTGFQNALEGSVLQGRFSTIEEALSSLEDVGERVGASLEQNLGNAFGDFVTGAQKGKDAFRSFVLGVLNDSARAFASKAVQQLLGMILSSAGGNFLQGMDFSGAGAAGVSTAAAGGFIGMAAGGKVPAMLMSGEYVFGPSAAQRLGPSMLKGLNNGTIRKMAGGGALVTGGSGLRDDVPAMLAPGSFVVRKAMTERYGAPMLSALANGGTVGFNMGGIASEATTVTMRANALAANTPMVRMAGGGFAAMPFMGFEDGGTVMSAATPVPIMQGGGGGVFQIGVTIHDNSTTTTSSQQSTAGSPLADKQLGETLAQRMKQVALQTIEEQTRMGGMLRKQSIRNQ